jgi:REP element-mobilizing transposase RayT
MSHTYTCLLAHVVFSTKDRQRFIDAELALRLHPYLGGICRDLKCPALAVGGVEDHVHMLISYPPTMALANLLRDIKANSSKWIHETFEREEFAWQPGYGGFSVSKSAEPTVEKYIFNQVEHHQQMTLQEEFAILIERHGGRIEDFDW